MLLLGNTKIFGILSNRPAVENVRRLTSGPVGPKEFVFLKKKEGSSENHYSMWLVVS